MKASELRIGNLVHVDRNTLTEIESITEIGANLRHGSETIYFDDLAGFGDKSHDVIKPIPLTEEWLLKFGFERNGKKLTFWVIDLVEDEEGIFSFDESRIYIDVKYVHQLQNLYFALTGEELTLEP